MRVLVVSQYFWPENFIINDLVRVLSEAGHDVEVLTGKPNYPDGALFPGYEQYGCMTEVFADRVPVHRIPLRPRGIGGAKNLALNYLSFVWNGMRHSMRLLGGKRFDAILVYAPSPITAALPAIWLKWRLRAHLAVWIQDLWPESLAATGFVRNRFLLRAVGALVAWIYARADTLLVQSRSFVTSVSRRASPDKIVYFPNAYCDLRLAGEAGRLPPTLETLLESHDCVVFAGNIGRAQAMGTLVDAAARLSDLTHFRLVIVGSGSELQATKDEAVRRGVENIMFAGRFPPALMPEIFVRSAALLVSLTREEIFSLTIPSKVQAYFAAGRPVIGCLDGEGARVIEEAGAGWACPAEDAEALASTIRRLMATTPEERARLGRAGRCYFLKHFEMRSQALRLIDILNGRGE